jgi:hypothetical protein
MLKAGDVSKIETKRAPKRKKRIFKGRQTRIILFYMDLWLMDGKWERKTKCSNKSTQFFFVSQKVTAAAQFFFIS